MCTQQYKYYYTIQYNGTIQYNEKYDYIKGQWWIR